MAGHTLFAGWRVRGLHRLGVPQDVTVACETERTAFRGDEMPVVAGMRHMTRVALACLKRKVDGGPLYSLKHGLVAGKAQFGFPFDQQRLLRGRVGRMALDAVAPARGRVDIRLICLKQIRPVPN